MIVKCRTCGEKYDDELFPVCPYCLSAKVLEDSETIAPKIAEEKNTAAVSLFDTKGDHMDPAKAENGNTDEVAVNEMSTPQVENNTLTEYMVRLSGGTVLERGKYVDQDIKRVKIDLSEDSALSGRARNFLLRNRISTISDLQRFVNETDLLELKNIGEKTAEELYDLVENYSNIIDTGKVTNEIENGDSINSVFCENKYNLFVKYCSENGLVYISDLNGFDFEQLNDVRGLGKGKIREIFSKYQEYISSDNNNPTHVAEQRPAIKKCLFKNINRQLAGLDIGFLRGLGIKPKQLERLRECGVITISDLEDLSAYQLERIIGRYNIDKYKILSDSLQKDLIDVFQDVLTASEDTSGYEYTLLRAEGYTLQDVGELVDLTRERVRQVVEKFVRKLDSFMDPIVGSFVDQKGYITVQEILDIYDNDDFDKILIYWCKNSGHVNYVDYADVFLPIGINIEANETDLFFNAEELIGDGIAVSEHIDELASLIEDQRYSYMDTDSLISFLQSHNYRLYGDYIIKGRQSYGALCARIVRKWFPEGIKLYDPDDLNRVRQLATKEYGNIELPSDNRALSIRLSDYLVLRGRGIYIAEENINVDNRLLEELRDYIEEQPEAKIYYSDLYAKFEGLISMLSNIDNYNYLHGVLKLYLSQDYDCSNRDYLRKQGEGLISLSLCDKIRNLVVRMQRPVHKKEIKSEYPGVTNIMLSNAVSGSNELFPWNDNEYASTDIIHISEDEKKYLYDVIMTIMDETNGYCSANLLYSEVRQGNSLIIDNNNISAANNLYYLCSHLFSDKLDFRAPHICRPGMFDTMSIKNVALQMLGNPINLYYGDYLKVAERLNWSNGTTSIVYSDIKNDYFRVSLDLYIRADAIEITEQELEKVQSWLNSQMKKGFFSLITAEFEGLPNLKYEWNSFLLRSIIDHYLISFKVIESTSKDRRVEKGIVINAGSIIDNYVDLVIWFMKENDITILPENKMLSLLVINGFTYKIIPKDLYLSDKLIYNGELFSIE